MQPKLYHLIFLTAAIIIVFSPAFFSEISMIDDSDMIGHLRNTDALSLKQIFFPGASDGLYYRPMIGISFFMDKYLFGLNSFGMHMHSVLLHLLNSVLIYLIVMKTVRTSETKKSLLPLTAALLFGLHPINTESVNWISGRTDVFGAFFILSGTIYLLKFRETHSKKHLALFAVLFMGGMLTKETVIAFLPGIFLIFSAWRRESPMFSHSESAHESSGEKYKYFLVAVAVVALVLIMRVVAFTSNNMRIKNSYDMIFFDLRHTFFTSMRALGFYIKKLVIPNPLNFGIMGVDPLYELLAFPLLAICILIGLRRTIAAAFFISGVFLIIPSFIVALNKLAWTPYAERYLYISSAFIVISIILYLRDKVIRTSLKNLAVILILLMSTVTFSRNLLWRTNYTLIKDTVEKSPDFREARITYAGQLWSKKDYDGAVEQLEKAKSLFYFGYDERPDFYIAEIKAEQGDIVEAIKITEGVFEKSKGKSQKALENLVSFMEKKMEQSTDKDERNALSKKLQEYRSKAAKIKR